MAHHGTAEDRQGIFPLGQVIEGIPELFEGRYPSLRRIIRNLEPSGYGVPIRMDNGSDLAELIGYAMPTDHEITEVVMCFDDGEVFVVHAGASDEQRLLFQQTFYPRQLPLTAMVTHMNIADAVGTLLNEMPHDKGVLLWNANPAHTQAINGVVGEMLPQLERLRRERLEAIEATSGPLFGGLGRLVGIELEA